MRNFYIRQILILFLCVTFQQINAAEVAYAFSGGRFGDNLVAYLHAKWLSFKHNIPLRYTPFPYSDQLFLHDCEKSSSKKLPTILLKKNNLSVINPTAPILYVVPYFSEFLSEHKINPQWIYFKVDWKNPEFKTLIKNLISPKNHLLSYDIPHNKISVALHIRKGGGFDDPLLSDAINIDRPLNQYADYKDILKFPPEQFYIEQLKYISEYFNNAPLYVHIFTDDKNPAAIVERLMSNLAEYANLEFNYRPSDNQHDKNVLEDFFTLTKFDCLVRPQSNFSLIAAKISDYKLEIFPIKGHWNNTRPIIDEIGIEKG